MEIPADLQKRFGFAPLGPADGPVKRAILGENANRVQRLPERTALRGDVMEQARETYRAGGALRSNLAYGWVRAT